eukprot:gene19499-26162_t
MGVLDELSSDSDADSDDKAPHEKGGGSSNKDKDPEALAGEEGGPAKKGKKITMEDLQRQGYQAGPSILHLKAPEETGDCNWAWSSGMDAKEKEAAERQANTFAVTSGVEQSAEHAIKASILANKLRDDMRAEREQRKEEKNLTYSQKEKRKREDGKAKGGSYVEEEKRLLRDHGVFSGFD